MSRPDPVLQNAAKEGRTIALAWALATATTCLTSYALGGPSGPSWGRSPVLGTGVPCWVMFGVFLPWALAAGFSIAFAVWGMADDDLGKDRHGD